MNQLGWRNKLRNVKKQRDEALARVAELEAQEGDTADMEALKNELKGAKMQIGRLKSQVAKLKK